MEVPSVFLTLKHDIGRESLSWRGARELGSAIALRVPIHNFKLMHGCGHVRNQKTVIGVFGAQPESTACFIVMEIYALKDNRWLPGEIEIRFV